MIDLDTWLRPAREDGFDDYGTVPGGLGSFVVLIRACRPTEDPGPQNGVISDYYTQSNIAYHAAKDFAANLRAQGYSARAADGENVKALIAAANLGLRAHNTLTVHARFGSFFTAEVVTTDAPVPARAAAPARAICADCGLCAKACPGGALDGKGGFAREKCLRHWMDRPHETPDGLIPLLGRRLLGCEECQTACPLNAAIPARACDEELFRATRLEALASGEREVYAYLARRIGPNLAGNRLRAQALFAAFNAGLIGARALGGLLDDPSPRVARTAARLAATPPRGRFENLK